MPAKRPCGERTGGKCGKKEKRGEAALINPELLDPAVRSAVREAWERKSRCTHGSIELDCEPFPHCKISNFIGNESFAEGLQDELLQLHFNSKSNDLYKFLQSDDLKKRKEHHISEIRSLVFQQFRSWLEEVVGVGLEQTVDLSCARYEQTDVLLCHDDELEGRRVAFILYLVPPWDISDGGTLDLYSTDEDHQPVRVVKSLVPCWNTLLFFEVSPLSFHQVSEVLAEGKCRLSLSGWFHGPSLPRPPRYIEPPTPRHTHAPRDENVLFEWVNETYMDPLYQAQVQQEFEDSSEIRLPNFLQEEKFKQVSEAIRLAEVQWKRRGPPNKRCYARVEVDSMPSCLKECWDLFSSEPFFLLLSNLTGLALHYLAPRDEDEDGESAGEDGESAGEDGESAGEDGESAGKDREKAEKEGSDPAAQGPSNSSPQKKPKGPPVCVGELRRWTLGDYTLLDDCVQREFALDLLLHLGCGGWKAEFGGFTSYIAHDEDEELLTVYPEENSLALVYRDKETLKFVKHINTSSTVLRPDQTDPAFYDFSFTYYE